MDMATIIYLIGYPISTHHLQRLAAAAPIISSSSLHSNVVKSTKAHVKTSVTPSLSPASFVSGPSSPQHVSDSDNESITIHSISTSMSPSRSSSLAHPNFTIVPSSQPGKHVDRTMQPTAVKNLVSTSSDGNYGIVYVRVISMCLHHDMVPYFVCNLYISEKVKKGAYNVYFVYTFVRVHLVCVCMCVCVCACVRTCVHVCMYIA